MHIGFAERHTARHLNLKRIHHLTPCRDNPIVKPLCHFVFMAELNISVWCYTRVAYERKEETGGGSDGEDKVEVAEAIEPTLYSTCAFLQAFFL